MGRGRECRGKEEGWISVFLSQIEECVWQLKEKEKHLSQLQEQEKALQTQFMDSVGENNKFKDFLLKASHMIAT